MGIFDLSEHSLFRIAIRRYPGRKWQHNGITLLKRGDIFIELHLNNQRLLEIMNSHDLHHATWQAYSEFLRGLKQLAAFFLQDKRAARAQGVVAVTLLHRRWLNRLGFTIIPIRNSFLRCCIAVYQRFLLRLYRNPDFPRSTALAAEPVILYLSREELIKRYGQT